MEHQHPFDRFAQTLAQPRSRRGLLRTFGVGLAAAAAGTLAPRLGRTLADNPCASGLSLCGGGCKDLQNDPANCGSCGNALPPGGQCINGQPGQSYSPQPPPGTIIIHQTVPNAQVPQLFDPSRTSNGAPAAAGTGSGSSGNTANAAGGTIACDDKHPCAAGCCSGGFCQPGTLDTACGAPGTGYGVACQDCTTGPPQAHCQTIGDGTGGVCSNHCDARHSCGAGFCCNSETRCVAGTTDTVCGSGTTCEDCTLGQGHCQSGVCHNTCAQLGGVCNQQLPCCAASQGFFGQTGAQICNGPLGADGTCACNTAAHYTTCFGLIDSDTKVPGCCPPDAPCCSDQCIEPDRCCGGRPCNIYGTTGAVCVNGQCLCNVIDGVAVPGGGQPACYPTPGPNLTIGEVAFCCPPGQTCSADNTRCIGCEDTGGTTCRGANDKNCCPHGQDCCTIDIDPAHPVNVCCPAGMHCLGGNGGNGTCACNADPQGNNLTTCGFVNGVPGPNATCCPNPPGCPDGVHCGCDAQHPCASGCCHDGSCQPGTTPLACGFSGACAVCDTGQSCSSGTCVSACAGHACPDGTCWDPMISGCVAAAQCFNGAGGTCCNGCCCGFCQPGLSTCCVEGICQCSPSSTPICGSGLLCCSVFNNGTLEGKCCSGPRGDVCAQGASGTFFCCPLGGGTCGNDQSCCYGATGGPACCNANQSCIGGACV